MEPRAISLSMFLALLIPLSPLWSQQNTDFSTWSDAQKESFLLGAKVVKKKKVSTGVTGTLRVTLSDGQYTHDASVQSIDVYKASHSTPRGIELNFRDCYKYNIAAYRLDRLLNLHMVPVSVERKFGGKKASVTWWVDDVAMMDKKRYQKKIAPPNRARWNDQMFQVRIFNELVYNTDPNLGNLLITKDWDLVMIDFSRGFRRHKELMKPENLKNCKLDRRFYTGMRKLDQALVEQHLADLLAETEIEGLIARRDRILTYFAQQIAERGEISVLCSLPGH